MTDNPNGTGLDALAGAFEAHLTAPGDNQEADDGHDTADASPDEGEVEAQQDDAEPKATDDEDEADDAEAEEPEGEEESDDAEESPEAGPLAADAKVTLAIGDKTETLTAREIADGLMMRRDYTRKTSELAAERKELTRERAQLAAMIPAIEAQLAELAPEIPDWDRLWAEDPIEAARQSHLHQQYRETREAAAKEKARLDAELSKAREVQTAELQQREWTKALAANPDWAKPERWERVQRGILDYARDLGYSAQDLQAADMDARVLQTLADAAAYKALKTAKPVAKPVQQTAQRPSPRPAAPSSKASSAPVSDVTRAKQRLAKTGKLTDAAALFEHFV